LIKKDFYR